MNHQALFDFSEKQVYLFKHGIEVIKQRSSKQTNKKKTSENEMSIFMTVIDDDDDDIWMIK